MSRRACVLSASALTAHCQPHHFRRRASTAALRQKLWASALLSITFLLWSGLWPRVAATTPPADAREQAQRALRSGDQSLQAGDTSDAERQYLEALSLDPTYWPAYPVVADFYALSMNDCQRAVPYYQIYFERVAQPVYEHSQVVNNAVLCYVKLERWGRGIELLERWRQELRERSDHARARAALRRRAELEYMSGDYGRALTTLQRVLLDDYSDREAHMLRAHCRRLLGRHEQALKDYRSIQRTFDGVPWITFYVGVTLSLLERHGEAVDTLQASIHIDGELPDSHWWLARSYQAAEDPVSAERAYRRCLELSGDGDLSASSQNNLAWLLITHSRPGDPRLLEALEMARRAVDVTEAQEATYCDTLAEALLRLGRVGEAVRWARHSARLKPGDPYLRRQLLRMEARARDFERAGGRVRFERWRD